MADNSVGNRQLVKNTSFLYGRMLFTMVIGLYTSRIILDTLGIEDFGIYSVVGGIVAMLGIMNTSMANATGRFFSFGLAQNNGKEQSKMFSTAWRVHLSIACLFVVLAEIVGLWFLYEKMNIPVNRMNAAFWVFQCSTLTMVISIMSSPYNAAIIAHEKMDAFAYISVMEVCLKLLIVYLLQYLSIDKLTLYASLIIVIQLMVLGCYTIYCNRHFYETKSLVGWDKKLFQKMFCFAGWDLYGNFCVIGKTQGVNMLLNLFFSTVQNAAFSIAGQVQNAVMQFANNVVVAIRPQIIKSYSGGNYERMNQLIFRGTIFISLLLITFSVPVIIETPFLLNLWLKSVPASAVSFCRLALLSNIFIPATMLLGAGIHATGRIKGLSLFTGSMYLLVLPFSYILFKSGASPESAFVINVILALAGVLSNSWLLHKLVRYFSAMQFIRTVLVLIIFISFFYVAALYEVSSLIRPSFIRLIIVSFVSLTLLFFTCIFIMKDNEKSYLFHQIRKTVQRK